MIKISACMMVKNEEDNLPRCLESIKDVVDEIIIVDTGSTDDTVKIAKKYTDKIYFHEWENNFSKHRNQSISYATGDWLLIIDADEELLIHPNSSIEQLKEFLEYMDPEFGCAAVRLMDIQNNSLIMSCNSVRLFRKGNIHYESIVHNEPKYEGKAGLIFDCYLHHYGYDLPPNKMQEKYKRTTSLLMKKHKEEPDNRDVLFYLSQLHAQYENEEEAQKWGEEYISYKKELADDFNQSMFYTLAKSYHVTKNYDKALEIIQIGMEADKNNIDICYALLDHGCLVNDSYMIIDAAVKYVQLFKYYMENPHSSKGYFQFTFNENHYYNALYRLALSHLSEGMNAWQYFRENRLGFIEQNNQTLYEEIIENLNNVGFSNLIDKKKSSLYELPSLVLPY
jgi:glycosyltransferase involved in cell wall biosynthesis